jgi:hypothetical protein
VSLHLRSSSSSIIAQGNGIDALENGVDMNLAFYALSILNAGSLFGRLIPNVRPLSPISYKWVTDGVC